MNFLKYKYLREKAGTPKPLAGDEWQPGFESRKLLDFFTDIWCSLPAHSG